MRGPLFFAAKSNTTLRCATGDRNPHGVCPEDPSKSGLMCYLIFCMYGVDSQLIKKSMSLVITRNVLQTFCCAVSVSRLERLDCEQISLGIH